MNTRIDASRRDDGEAIVYRLPLAARDHAILQEGKANLWLTLRHNPPGIALALMPIGETRFMAADVAVRTVPFLVPVAHTD